MSLHNAAKHLAAQGRGPDNTLVHMSKNEVAGLQALAKAHGTSLTVHPETGLPEAGALDKLMPLIVGAGLAYATGGASLAGELGLGAVGLGGLSNAAVIGGGMGLASLATGHDAKEALMTGLGGYGGAGLGAGLAATGAGPIPAYTAASGQVAPALTAPPSAGGLAGAATEESLALGGGRDALLARTVPESQMAEQLAQTTMTPSATDFIKENKALLAMGATPLLADVMTRTKESAPDDTKTGTIRPYKFAYNPKVPSNMVGAKHVPGQSADTSERVWFDPRYTALPTYKAAQGGLMAFAGGGPVEEMSYANAVGANTGYPGANINQGAYATPYQTPVSQNVVQGPADTGINRMTGEMAFAEGGLMPKDQPLMRTALNWVNAETMPGMSPEVLKTVDSWKDQYFPSQSTAVPLTQTANIRFDPETQTYVNAVTGEPIIKMAQGGLSSLGSYAAGGNPRLLKGPGDGMSDNIPAVIGGKQPARLADGEFVVPADVVSHLGNGSTDAGAKQLYKMMDRIRQQRTGKKKQAPEVNTRKVMPA